jgi:hypothetical protein
LKKATGEVKQEAVQALAWLGEEAIGAIPTLTRLALESADDNLRKQIGHTLLQIDPDGHLILPRFKTITSRASRATVLDLLRSIGPTARSLRRQLQKEWGVGEEVIPDSETAARQKWIYEQACAGVQYDTIGRMLPSQNPKWSTMTKQGAHRAAKRYAEQNNIPFQRRQSTV